jgi:hypothetical protein
LSSSPATASSPPSSSNSPPTPRPHTSPSSPSRRSALSSTQRQGQTWVSYPRCLAWCGSALWPSFR